MTLFFTLAIAPVSRGETTGTDVPWRSDLQHARPQTRALAIQGLLDHPERVTPDLYPLLIGMMDDSIRVIVPVPGSPTDETQVQTPGRLARKVLQAEGSNCVNSLQVALVNQRPSVRWRCAELLGQVNLQGSMDALVGSLVEDSDRLVRISAADALVNLGVASLPRVMELFSHADVRVRRHAIYIASQVGDKRVIEPLLELATAADRPDALQARQALLGMKGDIMVPILEIVEGNKPVPVKLRAIHMAGQLRAPASMETLMYIVLTHENEQLRMASLQAIQSSPVLTFMFHPILNLVSDPNPMIAGTAPALLRRFSLEAMEELLFYIHDSEETLQRKAILSLTTIGSTANPLLVRAMNLPSVPPRIKREIAAALKNTGFLNVDAKDRVEALILLEDWPVLIAIGSGMEQRFNELYRSPEPRLRRGALRYYGTSGNKVHHPLMIEALNDPDEGVRTIAQESILYASAEIQGALRAHLGKGIGHKSRAVPLLLKNMGYRPRTEIEKLQVAVGIGDWQTVARLGNAALTYLLEMLGNSDAETALWAAHTLAKFHEEVSLKTYDLLTIDPTLYEVMRIGGTRDNTITLNTLKALADQRSIAYLMCGWFREDPETRDAAHRTLVQTGAGGRGLYQEGLKAISVEMQERFVNLIAEIQKPQFDLLFPHLDPSSPLSDTVINELGQNDYIPKTPNEQVNYLVAAKAYKQASKLGELGVQRLQAEGTKWPAEQANILRALAGLKDPSLISYFLLHHTSRDPTVTQAARYALSELGKEAIPTLQNIAINGNITQAKGASRWLMEKEKISIPAERDQAWMYAAAQDWNSAAQLGDVYQKSLRPFLTHSQVNRRAISAGGLAGLRELHTFAQIQRQRELLRTQSLSLTNNVAEIRAMAALKIGSQDTNAVENINTLIPMLADNVTLKTMPVQAFGFRGQQTPGIQAAFALGRIGAPAYPALQKALTSSITPAAADNARLALALMPDPIARNDQLQFLSGSDAEYAQVAAGALARRKDPAALPYLLNSAVNPNFATRHLMKQLLVPYGDLAVSAISKALANNYDEAQVPDYLLLLGHFAHPQTVPYLKTFAADGPLDTRKQALRVLGTIGDPASIGALLAATNDSLWIVREVAAAELLQLGARSLPHLIDALEHPDRAGAGYPQKLLRQITAIDHGEDVEAWRNWWNQKVAP